MEDLQKRHITLAQPILTNVIATKIWLIKEIENKFNLTNQEKEDLVSNYLRQIKFTILLHFCYTVIYQGFACFL